MAATVMLSSVSPVQSNVGSMKSSPEHTPSRIPRRLRKERRHTDHVDSSANSAQPSASTSNQGPSVSVTEAVTNISGVNGIQAINDLSRVTSECAAERRKALDAGVVEAICSTLRPAAVGVWRVHRESEAVQVGLEGGDIVEASADEENSLASLEILSTDRTLWDESITLLSRLCLFESEACKRIVDCKGLDLLTIAARAEESHNARLQALAALAAIGVWSGPQRAVEIVSTPFLIERMCNALKSNPALPKHLEGAICEAFVAMSHRHRAREIMKSKGCDATMQTIAVRARETGDYVTAGRVSVAAGHLSGHSIDEYGFLVENDASKSTIDLDEELLTSTPQKQKLDRSERTDDNLSKSPNISSLRVSSGEIADNIAKNVEQQHGQKSVAKRLDMGTPETHVVAREARESLKLTEEHTTGSLETSAGAPGPTKVDAKSNVLVDESYDDPDAENDSPRGRRKRSRSRGLSPLRTFSESAKEGADGEVSALKRKTKSQITRDQQATRIWNNALSNRYVALQRTKGSRSRVKAYKRLTTVPIPQNLRYKVWAFLLDVASLQEQKRGIYQDLKRGAESLLSADTIHTIDVDVVRTMPSHSLFWAGGAAMGVDSLRSVLRAYAAYAPDVGYCQGMSSIAAMLLMNSRDEEEAFLMLIRFMDRFSYKKVFYPGFPQMQQWIKEILPMCDKYCPEVMKKLESENVPPELYMDKWLLTALTHNFPHRHVLRIWDMMFLGGSPKIILKASLGVLHESAPKLRTMHFEEIMPYLQKSFADPEEGILDHADREPFLTRIRHYRFLPAGAIFSEASMEGAAPVRKSKRQRLSACFSSCFRAKTKDE